MSAYQYHPPNNIRRYRQLGQDHIENELPPLRSGRIFKYVEIDLQGEKPNNPPERDQIQGQSTNRTARAPE
jgi:hypothetical protein